MASRPDDPDAPPTAEELAAAARLRDDGDPAIDALRAAWSPDPLDERAHAAMLDEVAALDVDELALASALREHGDPLVTGLKNAWSPTELPAAEHEAIVARALATGSNVVPLLARRGARRIVLGATTALAFAASVVVWVGNVPREVPLARERSTAALFDEPFREGETSARIDRIAGARAADFRDNQFAKWGAR